MASPSLISLGGNAAQPVLSRPLSNVSPVSPFSLQLTSPAQRSVTPLMTTSSLSGTATSPLLSVFSSTPVTSPLISVPSPTSGITPVTSPIFSLPSTTQMLTTTPGLVNIPASPTTSLSPVRSPTALPVSSIGRPVVLPVSSLSVVPSPISVRSSVPSSLTGPSRGVCRGSYKSDLLLDLPPVKRSNVTDDELFEAATKPINIFAGNDFFSSVISLYGSPEAVEPKAVEYFSFEAYQIYDPRNPDRLFDVASDDGFRKVQTKIFKIAHTRWQKPGSTGPHVLINHGVPANMTQWFKVARYLAMVGFRVVVFDMLTMGRSTKPLFNNEEKMEKLRWHMDVPYVNALADEVFGSGCPFIYLADDWGTGILHKYLEIYSDRSIWSGDQDGIRGGAFPISEVKAIGRASMLPMDERSEVLAGRIPPDPGSFQAVMGAADQTIVQILKTMTKRQDEVYDRWGLNSTLDPFFSTDYERPATSPKGIANPVNMPIKFYALKSMADRSGAALISTDLMPHHRRLNPGGIKYSQIRTILYLWSGENDNMMPRNQRLRYKEWLRNSRVFSALIPRAGHFSGLDQPEWIANNIIAFHNFLYPPGREGSLPAGFMGYSGIYKGNEREEAAAYRRLLD